MNKIISYIGFAIKSKQIIIGQSHLRNATTDIKLIMLCHTATDNLKKLAKNLSIKHNCEIIETKQPLEELTNLKEVKIIGITNENLSKAIIDNKEIIN